MFKKELEERSGLNSKKFKIGIKIVAQVKNK